MPTEPPPDAARRPATAAFLSFLFPGAGQYYAGARRAAVIFVVPVLALILFIILQAQGGLDTFAAQMIAPSFALWTILVIVALGVWRLASIGHAVRRFPASTRRTRPAMAILAAVVAGVVLMHGLAGYYAWSFYDAGTQIFSGDATPSPGPSEAGTPGPTDTGIFETPSVTLPPPTNRVTFLVTGVDSGHDRTHALTDTLLVVSVNKDTREAVMLSMPRDTAQFPMYSGGVYGDKINSLMTAARNNPSKYPEGPVATLSKELSFLIGIPINYYAAINLEGFQTMVDLVGGVDIVNPKPITDPVYDWFNGTYGFFLSAGPHHLDGKNALAYARSLYGAGDNDFTRAARQQQLLLALRSKMDVGSMLTKLPAILKVAAKTIQTDFPPDQIRDYLDLAKQVDDKNIRRFVLGPPFEVHPPTNTTGGQYILQLQFDRIAALSVQLFGSDSRYYGPGGSPDPSPSVRP
ncbi:MAG: LCP family protein [Chloroflexi bacterium]|nr:LCP family protein [Chloroflexota bacterium]